MVEDVEIREVGDSWSIPRGWEWKTMEEVAEVVNGATPKTDDSTNYEGGTIAWLTPADLSGYTEKFIDQGARFITKSGLESCSTNLLPKGTVLFTSRAPIGYVAIASGEVCTNQGFKSYVPDPKQVTSDYLYWWLKGAKPMAEAVASGTTFLELSTVKARKLPIPLAPLPEQRRIVEAIELQLGRLDTAVSRLQAAKAKLKRYKQAVLNAAVEGRLTEEWREKNPTLSDGHVVLAQIRKRHAAIKKPPLSMAASDWAERVPYAWPLASIDEVLANGRKCAYGVLQPGDHVDGGVPLVRVGDIEGGKLYGTALKHIAPAIASKYPRTKLQGGEVLISLVGAVGRTAIAPMELAGANTARAVGVIPVASELMPEWVELWLRNPGMIAELNGKSHEVARKTLNLEDVRKAPIAIPSRDEQREIIRLFRTEEVVLDETETTLDAQLQQAMRLRQAVLKRAFEGKLV